MLLRLNALKRIEKILARRGLGLGYVDAVSGEVRPPAPGTGLCALVQSREAGALACAASGTSALQRLRARLASGDRTTGCLTSECHAGIAEVAAPIMIGGELVGALLAGGFYVVGEHDPEVVAADLPARAQTLALAPAELVATARRHSWLPRHEVSFVEELLEAAADEVAAASAETQRERGAVAIDRTLHGDVGLRWSYDAILGKSPPMQELYGLLDRVAKSDSTVLIQGENGTGKELVARAVHYNCARKDRRFVVTNCSAFNDNLLDSELFGHKRGAFTGAVVDKQGLFEIADQGTFFLDEIGDMSPSLQVKVLRVLQEGTFTPVGDTEMRKVDVRIIAATNRDLKAMVASGQFREDLYYRINVINLEIPPLRDRRPDIPLLVESFLARHARTRRGRAKQIGEPCMARFLAYPWPGNVRELENEIERLVVLSGDERVIGEDALSPRIRQFTPRPTAGDARGGSLPEAVHALERRMILEALKRNRWNKTRASAELKISRRNLIRLVQKYELEIVEPSG